MDFFSFAKKQSPGLGDHWTQKLKEVNTDSYKEYYNICK